MLKRKCQICSKIFYVYPSRIRNSNCGMFCSNKCIAIKRRTSYKNSGNPFWKGNNVQYEGLHGWIRRYKHKPKKCNICKKKPPYDLANISGKYLRKLSDWEWICRKCHMIKDGRMKNFCNKIGRFAGEKHPRYRHDVKTSIIKDLYLKLSSLRKTAAELNCSDSLISNRLKEK